MHACLLYHSILITKLDIFIIKNTGMESKISSQQYEPLITKHKTSAQLIQ